MSTGHTTPGHEMESSRAAALAAAATEPVAWAPPAPEAPPQPMSFNPRAGITQPASVQPVPQQSPTSHMPQQGFVPAAPAPQAYPQDFGYPHPGSAPAQPSYSSPTDYAAPADYGAPQYASAPPPSFASAGQAAPSMPQQWGMPSDPIQSSPHVMPDMQEMAAPAEDAAGKASLLSRFKRKPKAVQEASGGVMAPASQPMNAADDASADKPSSSKKPFLMGVLTGIAMMLGVGFLLGGEPDPIPAYYAPSPTADTAAPADAPLAFMDVEEGVE